MIVHHACLVIHVNVTKSLTLSLLQVKCSLQYWQEEEASFASLDTFYVSETDTAELLLPAAHSSLTPSLHSSEVFGHPLMSCRSSSRVWRVAVIQVEWADEDEGEVFVSQYVGVVSFVFMIFTYSVSQWNHWST